MSYEFYKLIHFLGLFSLFFAYGGLVIFHYMGGQQGQIPRKGVVIVHGISLVFLLVAGFGLLARLGIHWPWPGWVWIKVLVWVALGGLIVLAKRKPKLLWPLYGVLMILSGIAAYMATNKPF